MSPAQENAFRSVARKCRAEILKAITGKPKSEHDRITTLLLDKHTKQITALPPGKFSARLWLTYYVRVVDKETRT
ncbi:hypothetical protein [Erwinia sp. QL-Z3]|uniref:hypothetical protein n=1 Tax=Erwinia sp. QL-Z3 TaxID=2547962 RepID=UPI001070BF98|nr:hypothetical protein [Erwinia sp. QL-Z3]QBR52767.1 hypothetical protein E2F51_23615 [Erwinia sp. QL-Z3]